MWNFWEQLQCEALSPLIVGMTIAPLFPLETCTVQIQSVWVKFACTKRLFNLSGEAIINVHNPSLCARWAILLLKSKQILFSCRLFRGFTFIKRVQSRPESIQDVIGDVHCPGKFCFNREMRISWWLCKNSEIHLWLWKVWNLAVCSQSSFYVTRTRKDDTNSHAFFSLKKMNLLPDKYLFISEEEQFSTNDSHPHQ